MTAKINAKTTKATLSERFKDDATLLKDMGQFLGFASFVITGNPIGLIASAELISKTAGAAISAGATLYKRLFANSAEMSADVLPAYDRFQVLYFVLCQRCYLEAIRETIDKIDAKEAKGADAKADESILKRRQDEIKMQLANLDEAEISYLYCIEPLAKDVPLFQAYGIWLTSFLTYQGLESWKAYRIAEEADKEARKRFRVYLAEDDPVSQWLRNYLALSYQEETSIQMLDDLASIREALENWRSTASEQKEQQVQAWADYRKTLRELPDKKETMFNESFGVRKVFLRPAANYHVRGASGEAGTSKSVQNLGSLIGALVSTRVSGEDLVILCGGPGSGKSTLCRMVASELAKGDEYHPVFLRLRRAKEGSDIKGFIEEQLRDLGLITRLADLRQVPNLVLILDGFDELVAASRSRLRHFFNVLQEDVSTGPLKTVRIIVSGRDTLFPNGEGLPYGSHVISLLPFDKNRITLWGEKWRSLHQSNPGKDFKPENFIDESQAKKLKPLHHLVSWPLTLHLVARVHTAGRLAVSGKDVKEVPKAYLYKSILAETADRQRTQVTEGAPGRFDPRKMREFLRLLAWEMYARSTDTLDPEDVIQLVAKIDPTAIERDLEELADTAVLNSPELKKGEDTGFEFVHKSFSEYLVAEHLADHIERVTFKIQEYGCEELAWRMSDQEAATQLAPVIGIRPITEEVQEMLEPMLGSLVEFLKGVEVSQVVKQPRRGDGLTRIVERFESLLDAFLQGGSLDTVNQQTRNKQLIRSPLEAFANYCLGILSIGSAAARQIEKKSGASSVFFQVERSRGSFWRCMSILQAGGITIDPKFASRIFPGLTVKNQAIKENVVGDQAMPIKLGELTTIDGYSSELSRSLSEMILSDRLQRRIFLYSISILSRTNDERMRVELSSVFFKLLNPDEYSASRAVDRLRTTGLLSRKATGVIEKFPGRFYEYRSSQFIHEIESMDPRDLLRELRYLSSNLYSPGYHDLLRQLGRILEEVERQPTRGIQKMRTPKPPTDENNT